MPGCAPTSPGCESGASLPVDIEAASLRCDRQRRAAASIAAEKVSDQIGNGCYDGTEVASSKKFLLSFLKAGCCKQLLNFNGPLLNLLTKLIPDKGSCKGTPQFHKQPKGKTVWGRVGHAVIHTYILRPVSLFAGTNDKWQAGDTVSPPSPHCYKVSGAGLTYPEYAYLCTRLSEQIRAAC